MMNESNELINFENNQLIKSHKGWESCEHKTKQNCRIF